MLTSLSKELKERNLDNPKLRNVIAQRLVAQRRLDSNWEARRMLKHFIWGLYWANQFPYLLAGNQ